MAIQAPKGTKDMLPSAAYKWHYLEEKMKAIAAEYGCREVRTPIFEHTELFIRGVGETTDVVQKEMYTFEDKGKRSVTLKAEGTAPAVRAFIENSLFNEAQPTKMFYFTPVFRYENVQKGRLREHHQFGVEVFGAQDASVDAEIISMALRVIREAGVENLELNINSIGCPNCRAEYNKALKEYLSANFEGLCPTCKTRFDKNPMRILDCKEDSCKVITKEAPVILDYLDEECKEHFEGLKMYLTSIGIQYKINPRIVRGLDYYTKTVFEILNNDFTVCGGGRYDNLIKQVGGPAMPAVGFGMGMERLLLTLEQQGTEIPEIPYIDLYVGSMGTEAKAESLKLAYLLRKLGVNCEIDHMNKSVKAQMKYANKINASFTLILGEDELKNKKAKIKRMSDGEQFDIDLDNYESIVKLIK